MKKLLYQYIYNTKKVQSLNLTPAQFFKEWKALLYFFSNQIYDIRIEGIRNSMDRREANLMESKVMLAGIYLDPMYRCLLTDEQQIKGKDATWDIAVRIKKPGAEIIVVSEIESISSSTNTSDNEFKFKKLLLKNSVQNILGLTFKWLQTMNKLVLLLPLVN